MRLVLLKKIRSTEGNARVAARSHPTRGNYCYSWYSATGISLLVAFSLYIALADSVAKEGVGHIPDGVPRQYCRCTWRCKHSTYTAFLEYR